MTIHLIHGIHTSARDLEVRGLIPYLERTGLEVAYPEYGFILGIETRRVNAMIVGTLLPYIKPGDIIVGHSNGCAIAYDLTRAGAEPVGLVLIHAALDRLISLHASIRWCDVYFNEDDTITEAARIGAKLGITDPSWGEMGHAGYGGIDGRVTNIDDKHTRGLPECRGHSPEFEPQNLPAWGEYIAGKIWNHLDKGVK